MDNPEKGAIKNGQSREKGNQEWTIQRKGQSRMDNPEKRAIKNEQSRETGNIRYSRRRQIKQKHNTIYVVNHYAQTNTNSIIY